MALPRSLREPSDATSRLGVGSREVPRSVVLAANARCAASRTFAPSRTVALGRGVQPAPSAVCQGGQQPAPPLPSLALWRRGGGGTGYLSGATPRDPRPRGNPLLRPRRSPSSVARLEGSSKGRRGLGPPKSRHGASTSSRHVPSLSAVLVLAGLREEG